MIKLCSGNIWTTLLGAEIRLKSALHRPASIVDVCELFSIFRRVEQDKQYKDEEQRVRTANSRAIQEMKQKMERELENAKLELLEVSLS